MAAVASCAVVSCGVTGQYVWASELPAPPGDGKDFVIRDTDTVNVKVFQQDAMGAHERVRPDGKIFVPLVGEVVARGRKPLELAKEIETKLKGVIVAPSVSINVEPAQIAVSVLGEVRNAGAFNVDPGASVLHALASAGGLSDYADADAIFVLRKDLPKRVRFRFQDLRDGDKRSTQFALQAGDVVVVE
jgi:polysaccharide export outer membrane protein